MLPQDVIPLSELKEYAKLRYLKILLPNKHLQEAALVFTPSGKSHEEIESAGKKTLPIIFKGNTAYSLNSLRHKQLI